MRACMLIVDLSVMTGARVSGLLEDALWDAFLDTTGPAVSEIVSRPVSAGCINDR